jgi:hypothetical protein
MGLQQDQKVFLRDLIGIKLIWQCVHQIHSVLETHELPYSAAALA